VRVNLVSLGCPKNLVDSEMILGGAGAEGLVITTSPEDADVIIVNTCTFIESAKEESIQAILGACDLKRAKGSKKKVVVTGCLAQRYGAELRKEIPEVDAILGLGEYEDIGKVLQDIASQKSGQRGKGGKTLFRIGDPDKACNAEVGRFRLTPTHYAYVKISEGCDNPCTFCSIPSFRGGFRSKPIEMLRQEVQELAGSGAKEIVLISQDTTSYGMDLYGKLELPRLLETLAGVDGVQWIRILYVYPSFVTEEMINAIASIDKVVKYVDIPLQHITDRMLRRMGRRSNETKTRALLQRLRERIPGLYLRTTFIVGFPGEDENEFRALRDFVEDFRFERLGVFSFSPEEGTPAATFADQIPQKTREARLEEIMLVQQANAFRHNRSRRGEVVEALVEEFEPPSRNDAGSSRKPARIQLRARSYGEAPEIDPSILVACDAAPAADLPPSFRELALAPRGGAAQRPKARRTGPPAPGEFVKVNITGSRDYDLLAELAD